MSKELMVFLSYAREDQKDARKIIEDLRNHDVNIWADFDSLRPGSKWEIEIKKAIKESRYFLAVLSSNSVLKKGHVQKEMSQALSILDEFPEQDIFIIPIRLNECSPSHEKLKELHWVDMFLSWNDGIDQILSVVAPVTEKSNQKVSNIEQTANEEEVDINLILSHENKEDKKALTNLLKEYIGFCEENSNESKINKSPKDISDNIQKIIGANPKMLADINILEADTIGKEIGKLEVIALHRDDDEYIKDFYKKRAELVKRAKRCISRLK